MTGPESSPATPSGVAEGHDVAPRLRATGMHKRFGGVHALRGVDFDVRPGEVHALLGENGAGKSTLVKILSGVLSPDEGVIEFDGETAVFGNVRESQALGIQTIYQELELALPLSVEENVFLGNLPGKNGLLSRRELRRRTTAVLSSLSADFAPTTRVGDLRIGDRQVVEIAKAMVRNLKILIMDEPTAALPPVEVAKLFERVRNLRAAGVGIIYISHKLDEVLQISDRITIMRDGKVVSVLNRAEADRERLVTQILGRELAALDTDRVVVPKSGDPLLSCTNLASKPELSAASFSAYPGEIVGFFGLLGSGQGAIPEVLFGVRPGTADQTRISELDRLPENPREAIKQSIGFVPADRKRDGVLLRSSIAENIILPSLGQVTRFGVIDRAKESRIARDMVTAYGVRCSSPAQAAGELSGGNQQKVAIAKWHPTGARILLMDEPTRGVDVGAKAEIYKLLREAVSKGSTCLIFSSDAEEISKSCDRAYVLKRGEIVAELGQDELTVPALTGAAL